MATSTDRFRPILSYTTEALDALIDPSPSPSEQAERNELVEVVAKALRFLPPREAELVCRTVMGDETQAAVAAEWGISKQRVSQVAEKALAKLKRHLSEKAPRCGDGTRNDC